MDIFIITSDFPPYWGGIAKVLSHWAKYLDQDGFRVSVIAPRVPGSREFNRKQKYHIERSTQIAYSAFGLIGRYRPRKVIAGKVFPDGLRVYLLSYIFRFDYYIAAFGNEVICPRDSIREKAAFWIKRAVMRRAKKVFPCSRFTGRLVERLGVEKNKIEVIYPGAPVDVKVQMSNVKKIISRYILRNKKVILSVSRLIARKGHTQVISALPLILKRVPNAVYVIVGEGPEEENLKSQISNLKLKTKVILVGAIDDQELAVLYSLSDVCIMLSQYLRKAKEIEGFGIAYLEAAAFGKPTIGTRSGGIPEAVLDGKTGLLVTNPDDRTQVAKTVIKLLTNKELAHRLGEAGRKRVLKELNWEVQVGKLAEEITE